MVAPNSVTYVCATPIGNDLLQVCLENWRTALHFYIIDIFRPGSKIQYSWKMFQLQFLYKLGTSYNEV